MKSNFSGSYQSLRNKSWLRESCAMFAMAFCLGTKQNRVSAAPTDVIGYYIILAYSSDLQLDFFRQTSRSCWKWTAIAQQEFSILWYGDAALVLRLYKPCFIACTLNLYRPCFLKVSPKHGWIVHYNNCSQLDWLVHTSKFQLLFTAMVQ